MAVCNLIKSFKTRKIEVFMRDLGLLTGLNLYFFRKHLK